MKYRFTPKVCGAPQHMSINGGPHATCLKVRIRLANYSIKCGPFPYTDKINLQNKVKGQVLTQNS